MTRHVIRCLAAVAATVSLLGGCGNGGPTAQKPGPAPAQPTAAAAFSSAPLAFEPAEVRFGIVGEGDLESMPVQLRNVTNRPVRLLGSATSCGCTSVSDLKGIVIPAGGSHEITASMKIKSGLGEKHEQIKVVADGWGRPMILDLWAEASLPIRVQPPHITATNGMLDGALTITSLDGQPFRVLAADGQAPAYAGFDPATDAPRSSYVLKWNLRRHAAASVPWWWVIETDRPDTPVVDVRVRHESTLPKKPGRGYVMKDQRMLVNNVRVGVPFEFETWLEYNDRFTPNTARPLLTPSSPALRVEVVDHRVEGQEVHMTIRGTVLTHAPGLLYETLTFSHDGDAFPFRIIGRVVE